MDRTQKQATIDSLQAALQGQELVLVTRQTGLTVAQATTLRRKMREQGVTYKVTKNTLVRLAIKGTKFEKLMAYLNGPTALAFSADPVAAAKVAADFAKGNDKFKIVGAMLGDQLLDAKGAEALAKLPSLNELRASFLGLLQTPATRIAVVLKEPGGQLARVAAARGRQ